MLLGVSMSKDVEVLMYAFWSLFFHHAEAYVVFSEPENDMLL